MRFGIWVPFRLLGRLWPGCAPVVFVILGLMLLGKCA